jgi:polyhydroxyalkanoate synthesis regulator phasin
MTFDLFPGQLGDDDGVEASSNSARMSRNMKSTIDKATVAKQEAEAKLATLTEKITTLEQENQNMKNQVRDKIQHVYL